jgi:hypothetical protein
MWLEEQASIICGDQVQEGKDGGVGGW